MKKIVSIIAVLALLSLTVACTQQHTRGAGMGAAAGGLAGALLDKKNPWKGGAIGAALGAILGATITDVSMKASQEAAATGRPVQYKTNDGRGVYRADPVEYNAQTNCHKVHERVWEDGALIKDQIREVCEGDRSEPTY
jgi:hypothetical protein